MSLQQATPPTDLVLETILVPADANERVVAESLLQEAGIPFYAKNEDLQDLFGWGQIGGANLLVGPVTLQVSAEYAEEARGLLAARLTFGENGDLGEALDSANSPELPSELAPPEPTDPRVAGVRRLALGSVLTAVFFFGSWGSALPIALGLWALGKNREGIPAAWRVFALCGVFGGLLGLFTAATAPA
jgi:hypothetical protein